MSDQNAVFFLYYYYYMQTYAWTLNNKYVLIPKHILIIEQSGRFFNKRITKPNTKKESRIIWANKDNILQIIISIRILNVPHIPTSLIFKVQNNQKHQTWIS